jgi:hypothetical protein
MNESEVTAAKIHCFNVSRLQARCFEKHLLNRFQYRLIEFYLLVDFCTISAT